MLIVWILFKIFGALIFCLEMNKIRILNCWLKYWIHSLLFRCFVFINCTSSVAFFYLLQRRSILQTSLKTNWVKISPDLLVLLYPICEFVWIISVIIFWSLQPKLIFSSKILLEFWWMLLNQFCGMLWILFFRKNICLKEFIESIIWITHIKYMWICWVRKSELRDINAKPELMRSDSLSLSYSFTDYCTSFFISSALYTIQHKAMWCGAIHYVVLHSSVDRVLELLWTKYIFKIKSDHQNQCIQCCCMTSLCIGRCHRAILIFFSHGNDRIIHETFCCCLSNRAPMIFIEYLLFSRKNT